jgi:uncharacterized repeat protein (TIGR03806 family)
MMIRLFGFVSIFFFVLASFITESAFFQRKERLSEYGFFEGRLGDLSPASGVIPYTVNTPLFSNYAEKLRFIKLPEGMSALYNDTAVFEFPQGTILIKNFYFPVDARTPEKGRNILETRLLVLGDQGWEAFAYIWNDEQTEAYYDPAGETRSVSYVNASGKKIKTPYVIPNKNQCKGCHLRGAALMPIGLTARQLNAPFGYGTGSQNQLSYWVANNILDRVPKNPPSMAVWNDAASGTLDQRARAYLDANCGHCHNRSGAANTSGLFLDIFETEPVHLGANKAPVAAGRGAGNLRFDIVPGDPENSILIFRMKTNDPAIAMPEIGREQVHEEGVKLIEQWIRKNTFSAQ